MEETIHTATEQAPIQANPLHFTGDAGEFFKIWFVNIFLTILTLGIYSAWAKVRTNQYLYGHTQLAGHAFRYLAKPLQILKGRIIAIIIFASLGVLSHLSPTLYFILLICLIPAIPWLILQGLRFKLRMTAYRNLRFSFHGDYVGCLKYFILGPLLAVLTFYLALPFVLRKQDQFIYNHIGFAGHRLSGNLSTKRYYKTSLLVLGASIAGLLGAIFIAGAGGFLSHAILPEQIAPIMITLLMAVSYAFLGCIVHAIWKVSIRNHIFQNMELPGLAKASSSYNTDSYFVLVITNVLAIIGSLGLAYPWARIRLMQYQADHTEISLTPEFVQLTDPTEQSGSVVAEETAELYDIDFSLT